MSSVVPEEWSRHKLGDSLSPQPKSKLPSGESNPLGYYDFYVCSHKVLKSFHNEYSSPSILFSTGGEASVHFATERYAFSTDVWATEFEGDICNEYVFRLLEENIRTINYSGFQGSGIKHLDKSFIEKLEFSIPPLPEQKKIASILTSVDEVIENTSRQIDKLQDLKKATMNELLTKGIGHTEFKDSELGRIPKSWEIKRLEQLVEASSPICYGILMPGQNVTGGVPVVKVKDIFDGVIHTSALLLTDPKIDEKYQRSRIQKGDLLITIRGTTGRTAVVPSKLPTANITQDTARIRIIDPLLRDFTRLTLDAERLSNRVQFLTIGQAVKGINLAEVRKLPVPMPRHDQEMKDINGIGKSISDLIDSNQLKLSQTQSLKKSLMQDLLTGKVRVTVN